MGKDKRYMLVMNYANLFTLSYAVDMVPLRDLNVYSTTVTFPICFMNNYTSDYTCNVIIGK